MAYGNESRNADLASVRSWNLELDPAAARRGANINDTKPSRAACNVQPKWGAHGSVYRCIKLLSPRPRSQVTREQREPPRRMRAHTAPVRGHGQRTRLCVPSVDPVWRTQRHESAMGRDAPPPAPSGAIACAFTQLPRCRSPSNRLHAPAAAVAAASLGARPTWPAAAAALAAAPRSPCSPRR